MAYSQEELNALRNQLLDLSRKASPDWSDTDDQIFNAFWNENKDNPDAILNFPIAGKQEEPISQQKSGGASPFAVENGVVTYNGKPTSELTEEERRRLFGSVGGDILNDPQFRRTVQVGQGDAGFVEEQRVDPDLEQRLFRNGQWYRQVGALRSVGGEGEVADVGQIVWDEELGWITPMSNVREYEDTVFTPGMLLLAGGMLGAIGMAGGFSGLGIGGAAAEGAATTGGFPAGAGIAGPSLETAGVATGALEGAGAATGAVGAGGAATGAGGGGLGLVTGLEPITLPATNLTAPTLASLPNVGTGVLGSVGNWFSGLSPMAQRAIMSGLSTGVSSIMAGRRQESAQDFARQQQELADQRRQEEAERQRQFTREQQERQYDIRRQEEERAAEERRVRGTPQQFNFNVTPRAPKTGILGSNMGG